jgi:hypothetical protein
MRKRPERSDLSGCPFPGPPNWPEHHVGGGTQSTQTTHEYYEFELS